MADSITRLLESLSTEDDPLETLTELKVAVNAVHPSALENLVTNVPLNALFDCLNSSNGEQIAECSYVLKKLLDAHSPSIVLQQFREPLQRGVVHPRADVRELCLTEIYRCTDTIVHIQELVTCHDLLLHTVQSLADTELSVATMAGKVITRLGACEAGLRVLFTGNLLEEVQRVMKESDVIRYRVYEVLVNLQAISPMALQYCSDSGLLTQLTGELSGGDVLVQVNCIDMLSSLAQSTHGLNWLEQQGVVGKLETMLTAADSDPMSSFYIPGVIKFFGTMASIRPDETMEHHGTFMKIVFESLDSRDPTMVKIAVETVGMVGSRPDGKMALEKQGNAWTDCLKQFGRIVLNPPTEMRMYGLTTLASLFSLQVTDHTEDQLSMLEGWFNTFSPKPMDTLMSIVQQPFQNLHCAGLAVLQALSNQPWAQRAMANFPGFVEYLVDRSTEKDKMGKEARYEVIKALVESSTALETFGSPFYLKLKEYYRQGPFYVRVQAEVAMEGSN
ncbi:26S proteasome non-ATPase regulatory subunit 5-like [Branchiostoma floridae x Branchiostoma japonicum]